MLDESSASSQYQFSCGAHSDPGDRRNNEDGVATVSWDYATPKGVSESAWLISVADGLGGHPRGEDASACAIDAVNKFRPTNGVSASDADLIGLFRAAFDKVEELRSRKRRVRPSIFFDDLQQPATTLTVATRSGDGDIKVANLGDSRCYVISPAGELVFSSLPHNSTEGYITKCIGGYDYFMAPDIETVGLPSDPAGFMVVCATDGVWVRLTRYDEDVIFADYVAKTCLDVNSDSQQLAKRLTADAVTAGGPGTDNATVSVVIL